ncbi:MAG TPA: carbohydrate ABC transporter permease [Spirochaetia bacterium]|nr:carbohydrate ABC transporter permease [Spirochaetia bacterium]
MAVRSMHRFRIVSLSDRILLSLFFLFLMLFSLLCLYPIFNMLAISFSDGLSADQGRVVLWPLHFNLDSWKQILVSTPLWTGLRNTVFVTVVGTALSLFFTALFAYPLSKSDFPFAKIVMFITIFCFIFRYPIIPYFIALKSYGLMNTLWVLIFAHLLVEMNVIIMRTFFRQIPEEMEEAAIIDGAGQLRIFAIIYIPLSKAAMASLGLFYAVTYWNLYLHPLLFIRKASAQPLQIVLMNMLASVENEGGMSAMVRTVTSASTLQAAMVIFASLPVIIAYPFVQKYFAKGVMLGSLKG